MLAHSLVQFAFHNVFCNNYIILYSTSITSCSILYFIYFSKNNFPYSNILLKLKKYVTHLFLRRILNINKYKFFLNFNEKYETYLKNYSK